jgi:hypothetical protein
MKFSEIKETEWEDLAPYLDTCLLPVTGLTGVEEPWQAAAELEKLRDVLDLLEIPYKGRMVTYPAVHFTGDLHMFQNYINSICSNLKQSRFRYVVIVTHREEMAALMDVIDADLIINRSTLGETDKPVKTAVAELIQQLWHGQTATGPMQNAVK